MKRIFDLAVTLVASVLLVLPVLLLGLAVRLTSPGPALYWSDRVGQHNRIFRMPKFRSMRIDTPAVATHLLQDPDHWLTPIGSFLRKSSLDELPQLWSIFRGDMSFVGPRPALFNQEDLIKLRTEAGVHEIVRLLMRGSVGGHSIQHAGVMHLLRHARQVFADLHAVGHLAFTMLVGVPYWDREPREEGLYKLITKVCLGIEKPASRRAAPFGVALDPAFEVRQLGIDAVDVRLGPLGDLSEPMDALPMQEPLEHRPHTVDSL